VLSGRLAYLFVAQRFVTKFDKVKIAYMVYFYNKRFCNIGLYCDIYDKKAYCFIQILSDNNQK